MADDAIETDEPSADHPKASSICPIDKKSVHRICSGQVVLTLATAVKELLENSIDAGATIVDIKLKEYGKDTVEVSDNGSGVEAANFKGLTLKHHTSKLQDFADLMSVETFGFRGEALSSLCALCDLCIITRHKDAAVATRLEYDHNGAITKKSSMARQVGTTVILQNLFLTLPVRHKEFQKNIKKEYVKMSQVLNSYCIISSQVKITCTNQTGKGSRSVVVSTKGNQSILENISNVFGPKQTQTLLEFKQKSPGSDERSEFGLQTQESAETFSISGYISKCDHGLGRGSADRQFYFINGRPFDSNKVSKVVNEVYHQYNRHQYPCAVLTITMNKDGVDVNVTPDKRQVFMEREKLLLAIIKASLIAMYEPTTSFLQMQLPSFKHTIGSNKTDNSPFGLTKHQSLEKTDGMTSLMKLKRSFSSAFDRASVSEDGKVTEKDTKASDFKQRRLDCFVSSYSPSPTKTEAKSCSGNQTTTQEHDKEQSEGLNEDLVKHPSKTLFDCGDTVKSGISIQKYEIEEHTPSNTFTCEAYELGKTNNTDDTEVNSKPCPESNKNDNHSQRIEAVSNIRQDLFVKTDIVDIDPSQCLDGKHTENTEEESSEVPIHRVKCDETGDHHSDAIQLTVKPIGMVDDRGTMPQDDEVQQVHVVHDCVEDLARQEQTVSFSLDAFKKKFNGKGSQDQSRDGFSRAFRATISPTDNQAAEQELEREIKKENFKEMEILGQFNQGFIITRLGSDLFIVDQHATDEKYNFETLQRDYVIQSQRLICPLNLDLTSSSETLLMDSVDIFTKNGFEFLIDETAPPCQRVKLTATPVSKNWNFGKEDIEEMIFMLTDSPGVTCRPSRVRAMFASRSCRKSVMIGTTLNTAEMKKLVTHMGEIEQPWNCPHGRPTMRHLINLNMLPT